MCMWNGVDSVTYGKGYVGSIYDIECTKGENVNHNLALPSSFTFPRTSIPLLGTPKNSHMKCHLSLPKNGSSLPSAFLTQNHGHPNAPFSSTTRFVVSVSRVLNSGSFAAAMMAETSVGVKCSPSAAAMLDGTEMSMCRMKQ